MAWPAGAINLPVAGMNLSRYTYYGTALPFVDVAHMDRGWGLVNADGSASAVALQLTADGYPAGLPAGTSAKTGVFVNNGGIYPTGTYTLTWQGSGQVKVTGNAVTQLASGPGQATFQVSQANGSGLNLVVTQSSAANPVRGISLRAPFPDAGTGTFNPKYKQDLLNNGVLRFMDWNQTNNSTVTSWSERPTPQTALWQDKGVPYELQIQLSNETGRDCWLTIPHTANDDYVQNLAQLVKAQLRPDLRVWVEYSNEVWNSSFTQWQYANEVLKPRYNLPNGSQAYGRRSAEIFDTFTNQMDPSRVVRVIGAFNSNPSILEQNLIGATVNGQLKADVAAVAPYFTLNVDQLYNEHLADTVNMNDVFTRLAAGVDSAISNADLNRQKAAARGIPLVTYEGGQHVVARIGDQHNNQSFVDLLTAINRDPRMGDMYKRLLDGWYGMGGKTFTFYADIGVPSKWGAWGLRENYLDDNQVKYRAVQDYLASMKLSGDFDGNRAVDWGDYYLWRKTIGSQTDLFADANHNGTVDTADYLIWRKNLGLYMAYNGTSPLIGNAVPEPSTLFFAATMATFGCRRTRR